MTIQSLRKWTENISNIQCEWHFYIIIWYWIVPSTFSPSSPHTCPYCPAASPSLAVKPVKPGPWIVPLTDVSRPAPSHLPLGLLFAGINQGIGQKPQTHANSHRSGFWSLHEKRQIWWPKKKTKQMPGIKTSSDYKHGRQSVRMQKTTCNVFLPGLFGKTNCAASRRTVTSSFFF